MRKRNFKLFLVLSFISFLFTAKGGIILKEDIFQPTGQKSKVIETPYYKVTIVPDAGGRILSLIDKETNTELLHSVISNNCSLWGGLLDDKGGRENKPYVFKILSSNKNEIKISLSYKDEEKQQSVIKELTFYDKVPIIGVSYTYINESQKKMTYNDTAVRNGILPGGEVVSDEDIYCVPTIKGVRRFSPTKSPGQMPEFSQKIKKQVGAPWHAFLNKKKLTGLTFVHLDDGYTGWYMWKGGIPRPTYEWFYKSVPAGKKVTYKLLIILTHGFETLIDAKPDYLLDIRDISQTEKELMLEIKISSIWKSLSNVKIILHLEDFNGNIVKNIPEISFKNVVVDKPQTKYITTGCPEKGFYVLKGEVITTGKTKWQFEDILSLRAGHFVDGPYERKIQYLSISEYQDISGWKKEEEKEISQPSEEDKKRGYMVYSEIGEEAGKLLKGYNLDLVKGEFESFRIVYYPLKEDIGMVSWGATNLRDIKTGFPVEIYPKMRIEEVEEFDASIWGYEDPFILHKLVSNKRFEGNKKQYLWLTFSTDKLEPGDYIFDIIISPDKCSTLKIPVNIKIRQISMPDQLVSLEVEGYIGSFGHPEENLRGLKSYLCDLGQHNADFLQADRRWILNNARARDSGQLFLNYEKLYKNVDEKELENKFLDFSYYNGWIYEGIKQGLIRFKTEYYSTEVPQGFTKWALKELYWYVKERGYPKNSIFIKNLDEQPTDIYPKMAEVGKVLQEIGWQPFTTVDALLGQPEELKVLSPYFRMYQCGSFSEPDVVEKWVKEGILRPTDEIWEYIGSGTSSLDYQYFISKGWYIGQHNLAGFHNHEYLRGGGERLGALIIFPTPVGPLSSPAWEGLRDGIDNANLYRYAQHLIKAVEEIKLVETTQLIKWQEQLSKIVSEDEDAIIHMVRQPIKGGLERTDIKDFTPEQGIEARKVLLDLLEDILEKTGKKLKYDIRWGEVKLVDKGELVYFPSIGKGISSADMFPLIDKLSQGTLNEIKAEPLEKVVKETSVIVAGTLADPIIQQIINKEDYLKERYTNSYPKQGDYAVIETNNPFADGKRIIIILGGDDRGVLLGIKQFSYFLKKIL
ncbi:MAG TPA: hypothetical protein PLW95_05365 [bacterium]|nr:hypothetical protein [bacterium]